MKAISQQDFTDLLGVDSLHSHLSTISKQLSFLAGPYGIPPDSGVKSLIAKCLSDVLLREEEIFLCYSEWGVWPSAENMDIFDGYRRSKGEHRPVWEAPVHIVNPAEDSELISLLSLGLFFVWDVRIFNRSKTVLATFSHDEWMEFRVGNEVLCDEVSRVIEDLGAKQLKS